MDDAIRAIASQPEIGEAKKGDLNGVLVYKFRPKLRPDGPSELVLTPLELIDTKSRRL